MATIANTKPKRNEASAVARDPLAYVIVAVILLLGFVMLHLHIDQAFRMDAKIADSRRELSADLARVRTMLSAEIAELRGELRTLRSESNADLDKVRSSLEADIQRVDDRIFAIGYPQPPEEEAP